MRNLTGDPTNNDSNTRMDRQGRALHRPDEAAYGRNLRYSRNYEQVADAIRTMMVRGAPAIGVAAAMGIALGGQGFEGRKASANCKRELDQICEMIGADPANGGESCSGRSGECRKSSKSLRSVHQRSSGNWLKKRSACTRKILRRTRQWDVTGRR